jgi:hypothetical protein
MILHRSTGCWDTAANARLTTISDIPTKTSKPALSSTPPVTLTRCRMTASRGIADFDPRGVKAQNAAATQRAAPTARRLGCPQRNDLIFQVLGRHKALQSNPWIAAPRPDAARLCTRLCYVPFVPRTGHTLGSVSSASRDNISDSIIHTLIRVIQTNSQCIHTDRTGIISLVYFIGR